MLRMHFYCSPTETEILKSSIEQVDHCESGSSVVRFRLKQ